MALSKNPAVVEILKKILVLAIFTGYHPAVIDGLRRWEQSEVVRRNHFEEI